MYRTISIPVPTTPLSPVEQHKADLEMIIAACETAGGTDMSSEPAIACQRVTKVAQALLDRIPADWMRAPRVELFPASLKSTPSTEDPSRTWVRPNVRTYDLGHWQQMQLYVALDQLIDRTDNEGAQAGLRDVRRMITTDGTVSITVRDLPE